MNPDLFTPAGSDPQSTKVPIPSDELEGVKNSVELRLFMSQMGLGAFVMLFLTQLFLDGLILAKRAGATKDCT